MPRIVKNASLQYELDGQLRGTSIYVMQLEQQHELSGETAQTRLSRHFYPRAYAPGDLRVTGRCRSQEEYQELALFLRKHHRALVTSPASVMFTRANTSNAGYRRLLRLSIPTEGILIRGWAKGFQISKKGVHEPAPEFSFDFFVVFDPHADLSIVGSGIIRPFYTTPNKSFAPVIQSAGVIEPVDFEGVIPDRPSTEGGD